MELQQRREGGSNKWQSRQRRFSRMTSETPRRRGAAVAGELQREGQQSGNVRGALTKPQPQRSGGWRRDWSDYGGD